MTQWEYEVYTHPGTATQAPATLNVLGEEGWEVYHVEQGMVSVTFFMKRPVPVRIRGNNDPKPSAIDAYRETR